MDLNRLSLRKIREVRDRIDRSIDLAAKGILALRKLPIDRVPPAMKARVLEMMSKASALEKNLAEDTDAMLRKLARSPLLDPDPEAEAHKEERLEKLKQLNAMYPGMSKGRTTQRRP
jgi:hypothetical protein